MKLNLVDSASSFAGYLGLILPFAVNAFGIFLMRQAFMSIPKELEEAAVIDGCSSFDIWWRVMIPLVKPALATLAYFYFCWRLERVLMAKHCTYPEEHVHFACGIK